MRHIYSIVACSVIFALVPAGTHAASYTATFDGPGVPSHLVPTTTGGFSIDIVGGQAVLSKTSGVGNGFGALTTDFQLLGDFSATVQLTNYSLPGIGEAGLNASFAPTYPSGFADVWSYNGDRMVGNIFVPSPPGFGTSVIFTSSPSFTLNIERSGNTLSLSFDGGGGMQLLRSATDPILSGPVNIQFFLEQETGNTSAHHASFDNLVIAANAFQPPIPEPSTSALLLSGILAGGLMIRRSR